MNSEQYRNRHDVRRVGWRNDAGPGQDAANDADVVQCKLSLQETHQNSWKRNTKQDISHEMQRYVSHGFPNMNPRARTCSN